jgi:flavin-dependent dehydrogenase
MRCAPPLIIGGGPAGSAAAIAMARAGRDVTLIERSASATDKVCGDFVSAEAITAMTDCGLDLSALAPAPIRHVRLIHGGRMATARLPFPALGLTRRALDEALLRHAEDCGTTVLRGHYVRGLDPNGSSLGIRCASLGPLEAKAVFLATGKHNLRGIPRTARSSGLLGLKMYYTLAPGQSAALRGHVELVLFPGGYAGLQPVEGGRAVLCALLPVGRLNSLEALVRDCPHLASRLAGAQPLLDRPLAIAGLPFGYVHAGLPDEPPGLFRLGDQAAVIASLTGDGVALALASGTLAARTWLGGGNAANYHRLHAARLLRQMRRAQSIHQICLRPGAQPWVVTVCRLWPTAMQFAANWTRLETISLPDV